MGKTCCGLVLVTLLLLTAAMAFAGEREDAKAELARLEKVKEYTKNSIIPLINCYASHQPQLQFLNGDFPNAGREHVSKMDYCTTAYPEQVAGEPKLMQIKQKVIGLLQQDIQLGRQYIDGWDAYNALAAQYASKSKKKKEAIKAQMDEQKTKLESMKQELYKHATDFQETQKDYKAFQQDLIKRYVEARDKANKK